MASGDAGSSDSRSGLTLALDSLADRRVVLFGGKGGVGKTTLASIAALHYAALRPVVLFTTDPASNLCDLFGDASPPALRIESLDAPSLYKRFLGENLSSFLEIGDRGTYLDREELSRFFELSLPGIDELMAWMRIGELAETGESLIVVDTAPTGHTLRMLSSAGHFKQLAVALDSMAEKHRNMVRQLTRRNVRDAVDAFIDSFEEQATRRRALLTDAARAAFIPVLLSEPLVVEQTMRLIQAVRNDGLDVPFAVLNRAVGRPDCALDTERARRDAEARHALGGTHVVDLPRACAPLDSVGRLRGETPSDPPAPVDVPRADVRMARMTFLAGKGGVGKTTCAASLALQLAWRDPARRYVIISVDPANSLRDVFEAEPPPENLSVETIDTRERWQAFRETLGGEIERAVDALTPGGMSVAYDGDAMRQLLGIAPPGADEIFAVTRLADLASDPAIAAIVVDTAPTGHFLRLLELPRTAGEWVREFIRILLRYRQVVPAGSLGEELVRASRALKELDATLRSDRASVVVVTRPERIVVAETLRLIEELEQRTIRIGGVVANYMTPENDCPCDLSVRRWEMAALAPLGRGVEMVERRDEPVTRLAEIEALLRMAPTHLDG